MTSHLKVILLALVPLYLSHQANTQPNSYNDILNLLKHPGKLVFDATESPHVEVVKLNSTSSIITKAEVRLSSTLYYTLDYEQITSDYNYSEPAEQDPLYKFLQDYWHIHPKSTNFLFQGQSSPSTPTVISEFFKYASSNNHASLNVTIIFIYDLLDCNPEDCSMRAEQLKRMITAFKSKWKNVKVGLEYPFVPYWDHSLSKVLEEVDVAVVNVGVPIEKFILTYSKFKGQLKQTLDRNLANVRKVNPTASLYAKLHFPSDDNEICNKYYYYLLYYTVHWINEGNNEAIILKAFNSSLTFQGGLSGADLAEVVSPVVATHNKILKMGSCEIQAMVDHVSLHFKNFYMPVNEFLHKIKALSSKKKSSNSTSSDTCDRPNFKIPFPDLQLEYSFSSRVSKFTTDFAKIQRIAKDLPWKFLEIRLHEETSDSFLENGNTPATFNTAAMALPPQVTIACAFGKMDFSDEEALFKAVYDKCSIMWMHAKVITWDIDIGKSEDCPWVARRLLGVQQMREKFEKKFPNKRILLHVLVQQKRQVDAQPTSLYCRKDVRSVNEKAEFVINFARIYNLPVRIKPVLNVHEYVGWWTPLNVVDELRITQTKFPVFVARNYPKLQMIGNFRTDPCIPDLEQPIELKMNPNYSGTTVYLGQIRNSSVTPEELQTLLTFAFHTFSLVEVVPGNVFELKNLLNVLSKRELVDKIKINSTLEPKLYLRFHWGFLYDADFELESLLAQFQDLALKPTGIHLSSWEYSSNIDADVLGKMKMNGVALGLGLETCVAEVNNHFRKLRRFRLFHLIDYVLCNNEKVPENPTTDKLVMEKLLDTNLYIQRYFRRIFPDRRKEIIFRQSYIETKSGSGSDGGSDYESKKMVRFLKYAADASNYADAYQLKMFMFPAFDDMAGKQVGWWKILNFERLANISVYIEKESEYRGKSTWVPPSDCDKPGSKFFIGSVEVSIIIGIAICVIIVIPILVILLIRARRRRRQKQLLSNEEISDFFEGRKGSVFIGEEPFGNLMFPKSYRIEKNRLTSLTVLGKGNFATVYRANLRGGGSSHQQVAVKIPELNSTKESFKNILSEIKILCYVGSHPNVLEFVGAYVEEIGRGTAYIVTELCENGALQEYLRIIQVNLIKANFSTEEIRQRVDLHELCRFAHEISLGMEYISSRKVVHGDLSTRNVLLNSNLQCKIGDFGLSRKLYEYEQYVKENEEPLPWRWMAVETLKRMEFTTKSDVWSYGVTVWEIFSLGSIPYPGLTWTTEFVDELENGFRMSTPTFAYELIYTQMLSCWDFNPRMRPTFSELSQFFATLRKLDTIPVRKSGDLLRVR